MVANHMWNQVLISFFLCLAGCSENSGPVVRDYLHINFEEGDLPSLHPHDAASTLRGISIAKTLFEGLTRIDAKGKVQLAGAQRIDISPDGLQYIFHLRDNRWSNGFKVTAYQYEAAWKEALAPDCACPLQELLHLLKNGAAAKKELLSIDDLGVQALGEKTLLVTLSAPSEDFLKYLSQPIFFPLFERKRKNQTEFNGPFLVALWDKDEYLCLKANPYFWNRENVSLRQIDVSMVPDPSTILSLYQQESLDWISFPLSPLPTELNQPFIHHPSLKGYALDPNGAIDFSYASFRRS
jgi:oligopeptide transport system substrate-binding protein